MKDLDFRGKRIWYRSYDRPADIYVVAHPHRPITGGYFSNRVELYLRRPGRGIGPTVILNEGAYPAGAP